MCATRQHRDIATERKRWRTHSHREKTVARTHIGKPPRTLGAAAAAAVATAARALPAADDALGVVLLPVGAAVAVGQV